MSDERTIDCVVCGSCVVDLLCRPVPLDRPIGAGVLHEVEPVVLTAGGITSNSGITLARLGMRTSVFSYVGDDAWGPVLRRLFQDQGVDDAQLMVHPSGATSTTVVAIDPSGERSFLHCVGAPRELNAEAFLDHMDVFAGARMVLIGYYSLLPNLEPRLAEVCRRLREAGCRTALDAAGRGGTMDPLEAVLPHLDVYVPSHAEASHQTGESEPRRIVDRYRSCGAPGVLGVKLGTQGVLLSERAGAYVEVPAATPPGPVVDTTGAGDCFYAGLLTGLLRGMSLEEAGRLGVAAGACCVTAVGGWAGTRSWEQTRAIAGID